MRSLPKPTADAGETFATCVSKVRRVQLKADLIALRPLVEAAATNYDDEATLKQLHTIAETGQVGVVSKEEFLKVYTGRMAPAGSPGRSIYDQLLIAAPQRRCPLCGQRDVSTLDHYLPESRHSIFVVNPANLIPACKDCNFNKRAAFPTSRETETFHPYFDNFDDGIWLFAEIAQTSPLGVLFDVCEPDEWDTEKFLRAENHFKILKLAQLYSDHAAGELVGVKGLLVELFASGGSEAVRLDMVGRARSLRGVRPNSWQTALYEAAATDVWFCGGGFDQIAE